ncbi:MAG: MazG nucleotide pyrophosphohydrolase domain-containing protein [Candidatus Omnitrophica bacterium]|nr:MazG nucleotide pyrophosphohydrolase domain-containing protein [Candidatus Omnitrophota bacterium]MDD5771507.1 MazG nucleotide pyrophosphohydrolase domain-containing protein [Candidatus Omnitrophota bacterium]
MDKNTKFVELKNIFNILHSRRGCMWDRQQTHKSLIRDLREEVDEFVSAVKKNNYRNMQEELGDILLHVMFNAQIAKKQGKFDIEKVIAGLINKLKRRHPHVFGKVRASSTRQIIANWNRIKEGERPGKTVRRHK